MVELVGRADPPVDLEGYVARLRSAGATEVYVALESRGGVLVEASSADAAMDRPSAIVAKGRRVVAPERIRWEEGDTAIADALARLTTMLQRFDKVSRFRLAASDMRLVAHAAAALVDAQENDGPARVYNRIIETGMVVTYARPFLDSNKAGIGRKWWPRDPAERELHDELVDLRDDYHAHAEHTAQRRLENAAEIFGELGRPMFVESWSMLPVWKLRPLEKLAKRLAGELDAEARRLDIELFGPND